METGKEIREVLVFEATSNPRQIQIPEELILKFEEAAEPFDNMRATILLSSEGCNEETHMAYSDEKLTETLISVMEEEIEMFPKMHSGLSEYINAGMPERFSPSKRC